MLSRLLYIFFSFSHAFDNCTILAIVFAQSTEFETPLIVSCVWDFNVYDVVQSVRYKHISHDYRLAWAILLFIYLRMMTSANIYTILKWMHWGCYQTLNSLTNDRIFLDRLSLTADEAWVNFFSKHFGLLVPSSIKLLDIFIFER